jgi:hypothetical protein
MGMQQSTKERLETFLERELAAVDTYARAVMQSNDVADKATFERLRREHERAAYELRNLLARYHDLAAVDDAGAWGRFARAAEDAANMLGRRATIAALRAGESHGIRLYRSALDEDLAPEAKMLVGDALLPLCHAHIQTLDALAA